MYNKDNNLFCKGIYGSNFLIIITKTKNKEIINNIYLYLYIKNTIE